MRRSFGTLVLQGELFCRHALTNNTTRIISGRVKSSYAFPTIFSSSSHIFNFSGGYAEGKHYHAEAEAIRGSDYGDEGNNMYEESITKGDTIRLNDLLFTNNRDYLIKNNNQHVKAEQLKGKVVGIYFLPLYDDGFPLGSKYTTTLLKDLYDELQRDNNFEVVLVAYNESDTNDNGADIPVYSSIQSDPQKHFRNLFSFMPWTAIPFSDVTSRKHMQRRFGVPDIFRSPIMFIVDPTGMVLQCDSSKNWYVFEHYGASGYPFSDDRLKNLRTEDYAATKQPSLKTLLGSSQRDYVISNKGDKVSIQTLEDKVVALYFYHPDFPDLITDELKLAYEELGKIKKTFEVVLVYIREPCQTREPGQMYDLKSEASFWEKFKTMPWLAVPFKDEGYKKLKRVFEFQSSDKPRLVIVGPRADYIEPFGSCMLNWYGIRAFPFTCNKAAELETEKGKEINLGMLMNGNTMGRDYSMVPLSQFSGKRVMLVLESNAVQAMPKNSETLILYTEFLKKLKERYVHNKGTDDEFEVVLILTNCTDDSIYRDFRGDIDWLGDEDLIEDLMCAYFWYGIPYDDLLNFYFPIFAFDRDGRLVRKTIYPKFESMKFPFSAGGLEEETLSQLITLFGWNCSQPLRYNGDSTLRQTSTQV